MVKTYLKYEEATSFGVISSANALYDSTGKYAISAALQDIHIWKLRKRDKVNFL